MTGVEISVVLWGISNTALIAGAFFKVKSDIRHLEDTKESKNGLGEKVDLIHDGINEVKNDVKHLPCMKQGWNPGKCETLNQSRSRDG